MEGYGDIEKLEKSLYADIIVNISVEDLDRSFQYLIPEELVDKVRPGVKVTIPFGNGNRTLTGYCIGISDKPKISSDKIKAILSVNDKDIAIEDRLMNLAVWMKENFGSTLNEALKCVLPVKKKVRDEVRKTIVLAVSLEEAGIRYDRAVKKKSRAKERLLKELIENYRDISKDDDEKNGNGSEGLDYNLVVNKLNISASTLTSMKKEGTIEIREEKLYRQSGMKNVEMDSFRPALNEEQRIAAEGIIGDLKAGKRQDYLIHGITGSGKTEVYMAVIDEVIAGGKQVIMLIPEIALTYQTVKRFYKRFGDKISVINSRMSAGERYDQYLRAREGKSQIVIGPRSALFTPFDRLGLIIIDEEHEGSYKSDNSPKYNARDVAFYRGMTEGASVILGSATPSLESYSSACSGRLKLYELNNRAGEAALPKVDVIDLREEMRSGNRSMFSMRLQELMKDRLAKKEQIMLFLNRRGYSGFVNCRNCGYVVRCPHCDVSLTSHNNGEMVCHYCGYREASVTLCPKCGSKYIRPFTFGTEKVEEQIKKEFPEAVVLRMDADTTKTRESYDDILAAFANQEADILVGTQMIVKGHDFPNVTLVGILLADMSLYAADYRSGERTFDLLAQAAGRAGRGSDPGEVVIQTYNPEHYSITAAAGHDYKSFYEEEMGYRMLMNYPPSWSMLKVLLFSTDEKKLEAYAEKLCAQAKTAAREGTLVIGPSKAPIYKINDIFRMFVFAKSSEYECLVRIKDELASWENEHRDPDIAMQFDFN